jgi:fructose-bisphosphate aldolase, class II
MCEQSPVPLSLMLDHGASFEICIKALRLGFTDVMIDHSSLPIEENIAITKMVVRAAHAVGAGAEAELGHVGSGQEYQDFGAQRGGFTDPASVERFVAETGVDMLAIAIGTAHGLYKGTPQLDLELLDEIRKRVDIPLVLHGGTGLSEAQFRGAISRGISKINVATDLFVTSAQRICAQAQKDPNTNYHTFARIPYEAFRERCGYFLDLFSASGQA